MAEIATIARPYADALFKASVADVQGASVWLEQMAVIAGNSQLQRFADNPECTPDQVLSVIEGVSGNSLPTAAKNFLHVLLENGRFQALPEIARQFRMLVNTQSGSSDAVIYSAFPIDDVALAQLVEALEKRFGRKLQVKVQLDPSLIGGIRVAVGDEVLDTSVKARLEQMKVALAA